MRAQPRTESAVQTAMVATSMVGPAIHRRMESVVMCVAGVVHGLSPDLLTLARTDKAFAKIQSARSQHLQVVCEVFTSIKMIKHRQSGISITADVAGVLKGVDRSATEIKFYSKV